MTDKELIKQEIERLKHNTPNAYDLSRFMLLEEIESFINSLPEESGCEVNFTTKNEDLDFLVISLEETIGTSPHSREAIKEHLQIAAEWQKRKDQETIELAEDHAMLAGMNRMKEEMMENAVDAFVHQGLYSKYVTECDDEALANALKNYNSGDKVKIIIVKEEQQ